MRLRLSEVIRELLTTEVASFDKKFRFKSPPDCYAGPLILAGVFTAPLQYSSTKEHNFTCFYIFVKAED